MQDAADVFYRAVPLMRFEFQEGIGMAIRKEVLHRRGALASPATERRARRSTRRREALDRVMAWVEANEGMARDRGWAAAAAQDANTIQLRFGVTWIWD